MDGSVPFLLGVIRSDTEALLELAKVDLHLASEGHRFLVEIAPFGGPEGGLAIEAREALLDIAKFCDPGMRLGGIDRGEGELFFEMAIEPGGFGFGDERGTKDFVAILFGGAYELEAGFFELMKLGLNQLALFNLRVETSQCAVHDGIGDEGGNDRDGG